MRFVRTIIVSLILISMGQRPVWAQTAAQAFPDSITFPGYQFYNAGSFKTFLFGENYRDEWTQPIRVQVFNIKTAHGGLTPERVGGGLTTRSLRLEDKDGNDYVLRTIQKFPDNTIPEEFRNTFVKDAVVDGISASYPYAALSIPRLAGAAKIPHARPRLVFVPDDPNLGEFREEFKNTLCIIEEREPGKFEDKISTENMLERLREDNDVRINQQAVLKARLLDMFIMDFDRHDDQWRWGTNDDGEKKIYFPIPRDRDQAFFLNEGFIPRQVKKLMPKFQGFRAQADNINTFNFNARHFDRSFLNSLSREDWKKHTDTLLAQMTDQVISEALSAQPREVYGFSAQSIINTLKERRRFLLPEAMQYYEFLAEEVDIAGTNQDELFELKNFDDSLVVTVHTANNGQAGGKIYQRKFFASETDEVRLFGLGGADRFLFTGSNESDIKVRIIGGPGPDSFYNNTGVRLHVYDKRGENNLFSGTAMKKYLSSNDTINHYDRTAFKYDTKFKPGLSFAYNRDDGLFLGIGFRHQTHGFRKEPYKIRQEFDIRSALATGAVKSSYEMDAIDVIGKTDVLVRANLNLPRHTINFFGFGNETFFDNANQKNINYFRTRVNQGDTRLLFRRRFTNLDMNMGGAFSFYSLDREDNIGRISYFPSRLGLDSARLYKTKTYLGPLLELLFNTRDNDIIPLKGAYWSTTAVLNKGLNGHSTNYAQVNTDAAFFINALPKQTLVIAFRVGGGINIGNYEFYQSQFLSGTTNLRGFRKFRFAGEKMLYNNIELRFRIANFQTYLFPGAIGLLTYHDVGRVWIDNEESDKWHTGYGLGIWVAPAKRFVVTLNMSRSVEGWLPQASFGFQF